MPAPDTTVYQFNPKVMNTLANIYATSGPEAKELLQYYKDELVELIVETEVFTGGLISSVEVSRTPAAPIAAPAHQQAPASPFAGQPAAAPAAPAQHTCACGTPMAFRPPGVSKKTGKPYPGFYSCANGQPPNGCGQTLNA